MARKRVTMQQLADACGLSRNTVSKIFNDRGAVPEATRRMVLRRAKEMGYYAGPVKETVKADAPHIPNIALLTCRLPVDAHFGTFLLPAFAERLSRAGYTLMMYELTPEELRERVFPARMPLEQTAGISTIELFDRKYVDMLCALGLPCVSVDACAKAYLTPAKCDYIAMESFSSMAELARQAIRAGARRLGFIGDPEHCDSFYQRWMGFCAALGEAGLAADRQLCILEADGPHYSSEDWLYAQIRNMPQLPDAFLCANDFLALRVMSVLKRMHLAIPDDILLSGFDGTPQSAVAEPSLTTVQIPSTEIGRMAADLLLDRIQNPGRPFCITYVKTTPVWRNSTRMKDSN